MEQCFVWYAEVVDDTVSFYVVPSNMLISDVDVSPPESTPEDNSKIEKVPTSEEQESVSPQNVRKSASSPSRC